MAILFDPKTKIFHLSGKTFSYVLYLDETGHLLNLHWGEKLAHADLRYLMNSYTEGASFDMRLNRLPFEVPTCGYGHYGQCAIGAINAQGDDVVHLVYESHRIESGKKDIPGLPCVYQEEGDACKTLYIDLKDKLTGLVVHVTYHCLETYDMLTRWVSVENTSDQPITLTDVQSASVPMFGNNFEVIHLKGAWSRERKIVRTPIGEGTYAIESQRGASGHEENPYLSIVRPETTERSGEAWGLNFVYSGSFRAGLEVDNVENTRVYMGMNPAVFRWQLMPGEKFCAPECVMGYTNDGLNALSQKYHKLYRTRLCRGTWRDKVRPVLINNWEATYFRFDEEKILKIARAAQKLGIELFVLDDGWFGKRDTDNCSLGDWVVDRHKLPGGVDSLAEKIEALGMKFGLWFEPEMISPDSDLYRAHPDWCLHVDGRPRTEARQQLILDVSRKDVQDYIIQAISAVLASAKISYVKWDMNRNMTEAFSCKLEPAHKLETQHRYMLGLYRVLDEITKAFPDVLFESCSGGGGRFDAGMLAYMPQTWTSDDTDPVERLSIQYGTSMVYPPSAMGAHVSASPNHQTGRVTSMRMRGDVAIGGNFGFELDLSTLSEEDTKTAAKLVEAVKSVRKLTQQGVFSRLADPMKANRAAWQFAAEDGSKVLVCCYQKLAKPNPVPFRLKLMCPEGLYQDEGGQVYDSHVLNSIGLVIPPVWSDFTSHVTMLTRVEHP